MELPLFAKASRPLPLFAGLIASGIILVVGTTYLIIGTTGSKTEINELTVPVTEQTLRMRIRASGTIQPARSVKVSPENTGRLSELRVQQGQRVEKGQLLAIMENDQIRAQGLQAQANLQQAVATLKESSVNINGDISQAQARLIQAEARLGEAQQSLPRKIQQAQEQVRAATARLQLAQSRVSRNENLLREGAISQDRFQEILTEFINARAGLDEAQQRLEETQSTNNPEIARWQAARDEAKIALQQRKQTADDEIESLKAGAAAAEARLLEVKERMDDTFIKAPFSGTVIRKDAEEGDIVAPTLGSNSSSILTLAEGLEILSKVPEVDVGQLQAGQAVEIVADAYPNRIFTGRVKLIPPEAVEENDVTYFEVKIVLQTGQDVLKSGMNVDVVFLGRPISNALVVPTVSIVTKEGETGVIVTDENNQPQFKSVTLGATIEDKTQILSGLESGDKVFTDLPDKTQKELGLAE